MINKIKGYLGYDVELYDVNLDKTFSLDKLALDNLEMLLSDFEKGYIKLKLTRIMDISQKDLIQLNVLIGLYDSNFGKSGLSRYDLLRYINNNKRRLTYEALEYLHKNHIDWQNLTAERLAISKEAK